MKTKFHATFTGYYFALHETELKVFYMWCICTFVSDICNKTTEYTDIYILIYICEVQVCFLLLVELDCCRINALQLILQWLNYSFFLAELQNPVTNWKRGCCSYICGRWEHNHHPTRQYSTASRIQSYSENIIN